MSVGVAKATVVGLSIACDIRRRLRVGVGLTILGGGVVGGQGRRNSIVRRRERSLTDCTAFIHRRWLRTDLHSGLCILP